MRLATLAVVAACSPPVISRPVHLTRPVVEAVGPHAVQLAIGNDHGCARLRDATIRCWGSNADRQLGDGTWTDRHHPVETNATDVVDVQVNDTMTCVLHTNHMAECAGKVGVVDNTMLPHQLSDVESVWMQSTSFRVLRRGHPTRRGGVFAGIDARSARAVDAAIGLTAADEFGCILDRAGEVWCLGTNEHGEVGNGSVAPTVPALSLVPGLHHVAQIAAGSAFACARLADATVACWGNNDDGQLGDGTRTDRRAPTRVVGLTEVSMISLASSTACALRRDESVWCWGFSYVSQTRSAIPQRVAIDHVVSIGAASLHVCALKHDGSIACWGDGRDGVLGDGFQTAHADPVAVRWTLPPVVPSGLLAGRHVASLALDGVRSCAILDDRSVVCWGSNADVIDRTRPDDSFDRPTPVPGLTGVGELALDDVRARAVHRDGHVTGWGDAHAALPLDHVDHLATTGLLACAQRGDRVDCTERGATSSISGVVQLAIGRSSGDPCVVLANHTVSCRHDDAFVVQPGFSDVVQIALGYGDAGICARRVDGQVQCTDIRGQPPAPPIAELADVIDVIGGIWVTCARTRSGEVWCWGTGHWRLGSMPREITWLHGARQLALGDNHWCALMEGDRVLCWGDNSDGALGDSTMDDARESPTEVVW
ncbi:MAG TPA: hypothetical protein VGO00_25875 [Kofleriaceae bacterium]|nr:hypothetical protein [Kofleriaceae bacterium]